MRVLRARAAVLDWALERAERLGPLAVLAAIPEQPRAIGGAGDRHGAARSRADALAERLAVLEPLLWQVARGAGDLAIDAQPRIEEQLLAQRDGALIVGNLVRRVGRQRRQTADPQATQRGDLVLAPLRARPEQVGGGGEQDHCGAGETDQGAL